MPDTSVLDVGFFFTMGEGLALDKTVVLALGESSFAGLAVLAGDNFLAAGAGLALASAAEATGTAGLTGAFTTGGFFMKRAGLGSDAAGFFLGRTTAFRVNVFETRADVVFFAEMGAGLTFITKKSLL
jgi:hypothetical protein